MNRIDAVFQKLLSGHQILITAGWPDGRTHERTGVTLNAPPPFFEWPGHKNVHVWILKMAMTMRTVMMSAKCQPNVNN